MDSNGNCEDHFDRILKMEWQIKYRLPESHDGKKGILLSSSKSGQPFMVFHNKYLNRRMMYANKMVNDFYGNFDIAHLYGKMKGSKEDSIEIARFDKVKKMFAFHNIT